MAVTIQMIETKEFKTKAHGYDPEEVDEFLDEIADEFEEMQREVQSLRAASMRPQQPVPPPAPVAPDTSESAQKLLANAQRVSDETMAEARRQADLLIADAKVKSDRMVDDAKAQAMKIQDGLDELRSAANDYRARFKRLVDDQSHIINAETELFR